MRGRVRIRKIAADATHCAVLLHVVYMPIAHLQLAELMYGIIENIPSKLGHCEAAASCGCSP
jgi:hypothetical protein